MLHNVAEKGICAMKRFVLLAGKILGILKFHSNQFIKRCWGFIPVFLLPFIGGKYWHYKTLYDSNKLLFQLDMI